MRGGKLSALEIRNAKRGLHLDGDGLYLQVAKGGSKSWIFRYRLAASGNGKQRDMGLGGYPLFSLAEARKRRDDQRKLLADGIDPIKTRKARKAEEAVEQIKATTFKQAAEDYIEANKSGWKNAKHAGQWTSTLERWVFPVIGKLPVASIDTPLVMKVLLQRVDEETFWNARTETASRVRGRIESILGWARVQKLRTGDNPAAWADNIEHLLPAKSEVAPVVHHKAIPYAEVPAFMGALREDKSLAARALEWTILNAVRTEDTRGATWSEIDRKAKAWTIPGHRLKGGKKTNRPDHVIPLSDRALEILNGLPIGAASARIFGPLSHLAMFELMRGMWPEVTVHGTARSSFRDWGAELTDYPNELLELALAHKVSSAVERAYRRGDMREKRRAMMADWAAYCASPPVAQEDKVVGLR